MVGCAAAALLFAVSGCNDSSAADTPERDPLSTRIHASYAAALKRIAPDYVVVTYPETIGRLPEFKRREFNVVSRLLSALAIPSESRQRSDVLDTVRIGRKQEPYSAYLPDAAILAKCSHGTVLFLNLDVDPTLRTVRHPRLAEHKDLSVMVWDDPLAVGGGS